MKKILITGGAGFIGSFLSNKLIEKGYDVTIIDNLSKQIHGQNPLYTSTLYNSIIAKTNFIQGDVTNYNDFKKSIKNHDVIVHLAAETGTGQSMYDIIKYVNVNIKGTAILLDLLTNNTHTIKRVIVASSRAIYGEGKYECINHGIVFPEGRKYDDMIKGDFECKCPFCDSGLILLPTSEDSKIHPTSVYGITKQTQEQLVHNVCMSLGISSISFRYQNVYGPGQSLKNPYTGILSIFSTQLFNGNSINIFEDGFESRDFVYIDDVVNATILGIENDNIKNESYNIGSNVPTNVLTVAETLRNNFNLNNKITITGNFRSGDIRHNYADLTKAKNELHYEPKYSFTKGIQLFCDWVKTQKVELDNYSKSIDELKLRGLFK